MIIKNCKFVKLIKLINAIYLLLSGSQSGYRKIYEEPILKSRQVDATEMEQEIGKKRAEEVRRYYFYWNVLFYLCT